MASAASDEEFIHEIFSKVTQLQSSGLSKADRDIIKKKDKERGGDEEEKRKNAPATKSRIGHDNSQRNRLKFIWLEASEDDVPKQTIWRNTRARNNYRDIQETSSHLFLAVVLTITPSVCCTSIFQPVVNYLLGLGNYANFEFSLSLQEKMIFESVSAEEGFAGSTLYLNFMREIFPEPESRQIQYAYGLVPRNDLRSFFETIEQGTYNSKQWDQEKSQGGSTTGCLTILIPTDQDQDGSCTIRVERTTLMQAINRFKLTKLKLE